MLNRSDFVTHSLLHKMNPIAKWVCILLYLISVILSPFSFSLLFLFLFLCFLLKLSKISYKQYVKLLIPSGIILFLLGIFLFLCHISYVSIFSIMIRFLLIYYSLLLFIVTTSMTEMTYTFETFLSPLSKIGLSPSKMAVSLVLFLQYIPILMIKEKELLYTVSSLGIDYRHSSREGKWFIIKWSFWPLLSLTKKECLFLKQSMELRNFEIGKIRTNYQMNRFRFLDIIFILIHGIIVLIIVSEVCLCVM